MMIKKFFIVDSDGWFVAAMPVPTDGCRMEIDYESGVRFDSEKEAKDTLKEIEEFYEKNVCPFEDRLQVIEKEIYV